MISKKRDPLRLITLFRLKKVYRIVTVYRDDRSIVYTSNVMDTDNSLASPTNVKVTSYN